MKTVYQTNIFSGIKKVPFFYSNFVTTIDGKVQVRNTQTRQYWPIGSKLDFDTLLWLRAQADVLIHGRKTATGFGTLKTLSQNSFAKKRKLLGKNDPLIYMVISNHPDEQVLSSLQNPPPGVKFIIVTHSQFHSPQPLGLNGMELLSLGKNKVDLKALNTYFRKNNLRKILVEGGPTLLGSFLKENLLNEIFITIAPKIFGNAGHYAITMVEGYLFPPDKIPLFRLISAKNIDNELYLRYRRQK